MTKQQQQQQKPTMADTAKMLGDDVRDFGRNIWLFGLGTVQYCEEGMRETVDSMVSRGETFQKDLEGETDSLVGKATGQAREFGQMIEDRVSDTVSGVLNRAGVPSASEVRTLIDRVEELTVKVDALNATR